MKRVLLLLGLMLALGGGSYALTRGLATPPAESTDAWLRREFKLDDAQLAAVLQLQSDYAPVCAEHCTLIRRAQAQVARQPDDTAVQAERQRLERVCFEATTQHLRAVAAQMSPAQGQRFLALMLPKISGREHQGAPALQ